MQKYIYFLKSNNKLLILNCLGHTYRGERIYKHASVIRCFMFVFYVFLVSACKDVTTQHPYRKHLVNKA